MKKIIHYTVLGLLIFSSAFLFAQNKAILEFPNISYTGTYEAKRGADGLSSIYVNQFSKNKIQVWAEIINPGPGYNQGFLETKDLSLKNGICTYSIATYGDCAIRLTFSQGQCIVKTIKGSDTACGFGMGVYADGKYKRVSKLKPKKE